MTTVSPDTLDQKTTADLSLPDPAADGVGAPKITWIDGKKITENLDGSRLTESSDGTKVLEAGGKKTTENPDGSKIIEQNGFTTRIDPQGHATTTVPGALELLTTAVSFGALSTHAQALSGESGVLLSALHAFEHAASEGPAVARPAAKLLSVLKL